MTRPTKYFHLAIVAALGLTGCAQIQANLPPELQQATAVGLDVARTVLPTEDLYSCADSSAIELATRLIAPSPQENPPRTDAQKSEEITAKAEFSSLSYDMYAAFDDGSDPARLLDGRLTPIALIYGDPGPADDRPAGRLTDSRTFYGFVGDDPSTGQRYIVFRGTLQPNEWLRNIQARQVPFPSEGALPAANVHRGFYDIFTSLEVDQGGGVVRSFSSALPDLIAGRDVIFIGHSLGGALATLAGVDAARQLPEQASRLNVTTFASPRVGDPGFAALASSVGSIDRVCNVVDVVTEVPPSTAFADYTHVGEVYRVSSFDWGQLNNAFDLAPEQIVCWHSIAAYRFMTDPSRSTLGVETCLR